MTMPAENIAKDELYREAEQRFVRQRAPDCSPEERAALALWTNQSPQHAAAYASVRRTWSELAALKQDPDMASLRIGAEAVARQMRRERRSTRRWVSAAAAAGLAAVVVLWSGFDPRSAIDPERMAPAGSMIVADLHTEIGEQRTDILADGSAVTLNTGTEVEAHLGDKQREIVLHKGEALFKVQHDTQRPFVVAVGEDTVTALGTQFQVRQAENESIVTLLSGSVRVKRANGTTRVLKPGERATLNKRGGIVITHVDAQESASWARGWLVFRDEPLTRVVAEVNRYAKRPIRIGDPALSGLRMSGNFRVGDSASMASAVAALLPLTVADAGDALVLHMDTTARR
jgi:transmembrane sensor